MVDILGGIASLFYGAAPEQPAEPRLPALTREQVVILAFLVATTYFLLPDWFYIKTLCLSAILGWLAGRLFDLRKALLDAQAKVPWWLRRWVGLDTNVGGSLLSDTMGVMRTRLREVSSAVRAAAVQFQLAVREAAIRMLQWALRLLNPSDDPPPYPDIPEPQYETETPPKYTVGQWHGILVRTPPVHDYGFATNIPDVVAPPIPWQSHDTSAIPSMVSSLVFRTHLTFCLVEKSVWECRDRTIFEKLVAGVYWDIQGPEGGCEGTQWGRRQIQSIIGIEDLGLVDTRLPAVEVCQQYYLQLRRGWEYMKVSWNDTDFAIILGCVVTGQGADSKLKALFDQFGRLRVQEVMIASIAATKKRVMTCWYMGVGSWFATALSAGLLAPVTVPMFAGSVFGGMGCGIAGLISGRERAMFEQREAAGVRILERFPQLEAIIDMQRDRFE